MIIQRPPKPPHMPPPNPLLVNRELERAVMRRHARKHLLRGGGPQRLLNELVRGTDPHVAADKAAAIAKGHMAELEQATAFTIDSGTSLLPWRAQPSPAANDTLNDLEVLGNFGELVDGAQVKVGHHNYVRQAICKGSYSAAGVAIVANGEAREACILTELGTDDRLRYGGAQARPMRAEQLHADVREALWLCVEDDQLSPRFERLSAAARAGGSDGLFWFMATLTEAVVQGEHDQEGWLPVLEHALAVGGKAGARTALQTAMVLWSFDRQAQEEYSANLVHKMAVRSHIAGAAAGVLVEAACDFYRFWQGELSREELLQRVVVNTASAAGGAVGAWAGLAVTRGAPAWLRAVTLLGLGLLGAAIGRGLGQQLADRA